MEILLETRRLRLRRFTAEDGGRLFDLDADPRVMRFITGGPGTARAELENDILPAFLDYYRRPGGYGFWAAERLGTSDFLGWFHLRPDQGAPPDEPELGYRLRHGAWGQGLATEGATALIDRAFAELDVQRVTASTMAVNAASRRVMEKAGMRFVRHFIADWPVAIPGDEHGDVEYALTRHQWEDDRGVPGDT